MYEYYIGIDPGTKTGLAIWEVKEQALIKVQTCQAFDAMLLCKTACLEYKIKVFIEDARLKKWYGKMAGPRAQGAGSVKRDSAMWEEVCKKYDIPYELIHPDDNKTKLNQVQFKNMTKWPHRTSEHSRDAAMLVYRRK